MRLFLTILLAIPFVLFSQDNIETSLDSITTKEEAKNYLKSNNEIVTGKIITFNKEKHKTKLASELFELSKGGKKVIKSDNGKTVYKILDKKTASHYRASIILFDSNKTTITEINSLRTFILKGIKSEVHKFENLARVYSVHPSGKTGGDLGWIKKGTFSKRFEKIIADKRVGQVFSFDEHRQNKHYVIKKTYDKQNIEEITVLKITKR